MIMNEPNVTDELKKEYPFLEKFLEKDSEQWEACCADSNTKNIVVSAGAGSGKTQVLATRFAWLVVTGKASVSEILTLTFTKKAAAKMYERIYDWLSKIRGAQENGESLLTAGQLKRVNEAIENFSNAHIQTIDSYCAEVARVAAPHYGFAPEFSVGDSDTNRMIRDMAMKFVLEHRENPAIQEITAPGKIKDTAEKIFAEVVIKHTSIVTAKDFFSEKLKTQANELENGWNDLQKKLKDFKKEIDNFNNNEMDKLDEAKEKNGEDSYYSVLKEDINLLSDFDWKNFWLNLTANDILNFSKKREVKERRQNLENCIAKMKKTKKKIREKEYLDIYETIFGTKDQKYEDAFYNKDDKKIVGISGKFLCIANSIICFENTKQLLALLDEFTALVNKKKRRTGNLTFSDVSAVTLDAFKNHKEILASQKNLFKRVMIDETQDNNGDNFNLLKLLGVPTFYVGDAKQSIYRFRAAEVDKFNELQKNDAIVKHITTNYRSNKDLINCFNQIFGGFVAGEKIDGISEDKYVFPDSAEENYKACFTEDDIAKAPTDKGSFKPIEDEKTPTHVIMYNEKNDDADIHLKSHDVIAKYIAEKIKAICEKDKNIKYADFAILEKSRTHRSAITKYLARNDIPFNVDMQVNIFNGMIINDFYNFLHLCVYPKDKLARNCVEQSPFKKFDKNYRNEVNHKLLTEIVTDLWYDDSDGESYCAYAHRVCAASSLEQFDLLFELARKCDDSGKTVSWFIDELSVYHNKYKDNKESDIELKDVNFPVERGDGVNVMTIHQSKGLQFKYVFVLGCTEKADTESNQEKFYYNKESGLSFKFHSGETNYFFKKVQDEETDKNDAELRRLFYVALTRAEEQAFILGDWTRPKGSKTESSPFEKIIEHYYKETNSGQNAKEYALCKPELSDNAPFDFMQLDKITKADDAVEAAKKSEKQSADVNQALVPYKKFEMKKLAERHISPSSLEKQNVESKYKDYAQKYKIKIDPGIDSYQNEFGTIAHLYLQRNAEGKNVSTEDLASSPLGKFASQKQESIISACEKMVVEFNKSDIGKRLAACKKNNKFYKAEYAFRSYIDTSKGKKIVTGEMDLIFENDDASYTIVDYKTDGDIIPEKYYEQLNCYRKSLSLLRDIDIEKISCVLFYLRYGAALDITKDLQRATVSDFR